jgi:hypothetical protein
MLGDHDDQALRHLAEQALAAARALYRTGPQTLGSAHYAGQRGQPPQLRDMTHSPESGPGVSR